MAFRQIDDLRTVVQASQDKMVDLQKKLGISALDPNHSLIVQEIGNLEKGVADATEARVLVEARYHILQSLPPDQIQDMTTPLGTDGGKACSRPCARSVRRPARNWPGCSRSMGPTILR